MDVLAFGLAYLLAWFGALFGLPELPEHELQLFMASHYEGDAWSLVDRRWYGGVDVAWRPPAFYVCTGWLAKVPGVGLERAYALVVIASVLAFVLATAWLVRELRAWLGERINDDVVLLFALNPLLYVFAYGLGQSAFVAALALCALHVAAGLTFLRTGRFAVATLSAAMLAPLVHPLALLLVAIGWATLALKDRRATYIGLGSLALTLLVLVPFFRANQAVGSGPVAHSKWLLLLSVGALVALAKWRRLVAPVLLVVCAYLLGDHASAAPVRRFREATQAAEYALSKPEAEGHRYLTLGLGTERLALSRRTRALLADGGIPWQTQTPKGQPLPFESIDALPLDTPAGQRALDELLAEGGVKWVVASAPLAEPMLRKHGYRLAAAWGGGVVFWEKDVEPSTVAHDDKLAPWSWTFSGPVLALVLLVSLSAAKARFRSPLRHPPR